MTGLHALLLLLSGQADPCRPARIEVEVVLVEDRARIVDGDLDRLLAAVRPGPNGEVMVASVGCRAGGLATGIVAQVLIDAGHLHVGEMFHCPRHGLPQPPALVESRTPGAIPVTVTVDCG